MQSLDPFGDADSSPIEQRKCAKTSFGAIAAPKRQGIRPLRKVRQKTPDLSDQTHSYYTGKSLCDILGMNRVASKTSEACDTDKGRHRQRIRLSVSLNRENGSCRPRENQIAVARDPTGTARKCREPFDDLLQYAPQTCSSSNNWHNNVTEILCQSERS